ncbi:MAG: DUF1707 domain-containing protein [Acidimicrobiales bacterium]
MLSPDARGDLPEPIRISDADRNEAVERINAFFGEGRLDFEETSARLDEVYAARTDADLEHVFRGLPKSPAPPVRARRHLSRQGRRLLQIATPGIICTGIWAVTGAHGSFWPEWVWFATGLTVFGRLRGGRAHPARDYVLDHPDSAGAIGGGAGQRMILTAVFSDIVGSTQKAAAVGDGKWHEMLRSFEYVLDRELAAHGGQKLFTKGDEVVATFQSPAEAVRYAEAIRQGVATLQLELRSGIHTGELQGRQQDLSGIALHIGQRVSASAAPGEILVSSTVRDLALGSGIGFIDRGEHELRGVPGTWRLYAVENVGAAA